MIKTKKDKSHIGTSKSLLFSGKLLDGGGAGDGTQRRGFIRGLGTDDGFVGIDADGGADGSRRHDRRQLALDTEMYVWRIVRAVRSSRGV